MDVGQFVNSLTRQNYHRWYDPPASMIATKRAVWLLFGINTAVLGAWLYTNLTEHRKLRDKLMEHTVLSWENIRANRLWTVLTSAFTHMDPGHFIFNMISLNAFSSVLITAAGMGVGSLNVAALAIGASIAGSAAWLYQQKALDPARRSDDRWWVRPVREYRVANGASGMVMGFSVVAAMIAPFARMMIFPFPIGIPMWLLTTGYIAYDAFYMSANDNIGRSAHLGGAVFGAAYYPLALRRFGGVSQLLRRRRY